MTQGMTQTLRADEHHHVIGSDGWSCSFMCPLRPIDALRAQTLFLEEEDHRHERRVTSSRIRFQKLSGRRDDESYKGNTQTF
ncbi:hypothetical protein HKD37_07G018635 [Glycine soja]